MAKIPELIICDDLSADTFYTPEQRELLFKWFKEIELTLPENAILEISKTPISMRPYYD